MAPLLSLIHSDVDGGGIIIIIIITMIFNSSSSSSSINCISNLLASTIKKAVPWHAVRMAALAKTKGHITQGQKLIKNNN